MALKVLVVDDDPDILHSIRSMVEPLGCDVLTLSDSQEAALRLEREKFDGILLDALLPHLDGVPLAKHIRSSALNRDIPIVMLAEPGDFDAVRRGLSAGATCFIGKPISLERLYTVVKAMRGPMSKEKRRHPRLPLRTTVKCKAAPDGAWHLANSSSISEGGISLGPSGGAEEDQELDLEFTLADPAKPLKVRGKVVRKELTDRIAVEFIALTPEDREAIRRYTEETVSL